MKLITIVGTRPEIIRLSVIMRSLDSHFENVVVDTRQNFATNLNDVFWQELDIRDPDYRLNHTSSSTASYIANLFVDIEQIILKEKPSAAVILGDTYSALSAIICERYEVPVFHLEAGNRCWDDRVPEERNRKVVDSISSYNLAYTRQAFLNLKRSGRNEDECVVIGNPILEVMNYFDYKIPKKSSYLDKEYMLATLHRSECVDDPKNLSSVIRGLGIASNYLHMPCILSVHPRLKSNLSNIPVPSNIILKEACGFIEFMSLEKSASIVLSDSGTVPEECCLLNKPCVTLRPVTERVELLEAGSTVLSGYESEAILESIKTVLEKKSWIIPEEYLEPKVSTNVVNYIREKL